MKKNSHRTMNSTHGPFFQQNGQKLPPLSALHKYEKSTKESDYEGLAATAHKRAGTNMDMRTSGAIEKGHASLGRS